jgi:hypothetical protein
MTSANRLVGFLVVMVSFLTGGGCVSTGLSHRESQNNYPLLITSLYREKSEGPAAAPLRPPIRLAVGQVGESAPPESLLTALATNYDLVSTVTAVPIPGVVRRTGRSDPEPATADIESHVRAAVNLAQDMGAEYLFMFGGAIDSYRLKNPLATLDITLVGGWIVPGANIYSEGKAAGALIETKSGRVIFLVTAEQKTRGKAPSNFADDRQQRMTIELRDELIQKLGLEFLAHLK